MDIIIVSGTVLILAVIAARVLLHHREFKNQEYYETFDRNATNEETTGDQNYTVIERQGETRWKHQATPKRVHVQVSEYYKNF